MSSCFADFAPSWQQVGIEYIEPNEHTYVGVFWMPKNHRCSLSLTACEWISGAVTFNVKLLSKLFAFHTLAHNCLSDSSYVFVIAKPGFLSQWNFFVREIFIVTHLVGFCFQGIFFPISETIRKTVVHLFEFIQNYGVECSHQLKCNRIFYFKTKEKRQLINIHSLFDLVWFYHQRS